MKWQHSATAIRSPGSARKGMPQARELQRSQCFCNHYSGPSPLPTARIYACNHLVNDWGGPCSSPYEDCNETQASRADYGGTGPLRTQWYITNGHAPAV